MSDCLWGKGNHTYYYKLYIADNKEFKNAYEYETTQTQTTGVGVLIPGKTNTNGGNSCAPSDVELFSQTLDVKTEIDLRTQDADDGGQSSSVFGDDVFYYKTTLTQCNYIFPDFEQDV